MGWTPEQFKEFCAKAGVKPEEALKLGELDLDRSKRLNSKETQRRAKISKSYENRVRAGIQKPKSKPDSPNALVEATWRNSASNEGSHTRIRVSIEGQRVSCLDPDNYTGGLKALIDCLQQCGLIPSDSFEAIRLETSQTHVTSPGQERTIVEIEYPDNEDR
jgi:hypothetical protein